MTEEPNAPSPPPVMAGRWYPLGATSAPGGVNFALYSRHAACVWLHRFDEPAGASGAILELTERERCAGHAFVPGLKAGQLYGYKVDGPFDPAQGPRYHSNKPLLDPDARAVCGKPTDAQGLRLGYHAASPLADLSLDARDDAPRSIPLEKLVIYETHLKGFIVGPASRVERLGTYLGFIEKLPYLRDLGVNAVERLPVQAVHVEGFLREHGLTNYRGYHMRAFFAPEPGHGSDRAPGCEVAEFQTLVRELHRAGLEIILGGVYNHSAEGSARGPTLSLRGIDNPSRCGLTGPAAPPARYYDNITGCGNGLDFTSPAVVRLVVDSLR